MPNRNITHDAFLNAEGFVSTAKQLPVAKGRMSPEQFCYWLQGYLETAKPKTIDAAGTQIIKDHLAEVFHKVTPDVSAAVAVDSEEMLICDTGDKPNEILACDTGGDNVSIWAKYGDKLPSIFRQTIYRLPTMAELKEVASFPLTAQDLVNGFTYTMVGRGVSNHENEKQIKQSLSMLSKMYPDRPEYAQAFNLVMQDIAAKEAKFSKRK